MPDDWVPKLGPKTREMVDGWPPGKYERELRKFRNHASDKGRLSKDWDAAFRTWLENADEWMAKDDRRNSQPAKQGTRTIAERVASRLSAAN